MYCSINKKVQDYIDEAYDRFKEDSLEDLENGNE